MHRRKMCPYYWGAVEFKENEVGLVQDMYAFNSPLGVLVRH